MTDPRTQLRDQPVQPPTVPPNCVDPATAKKYWQFMTRIIEISDEAEIERLLDHPIQCPACRTVLVKEWLRIRHEGSIPGNSEGKGEGP